VVVVGVAGLVDLKEAAELFRIKRADGWTYAVTFGSALAFGVDQGIVAGVVTSLALFVWRSAHPHTAELGFLESEGVFRNLARYPEARVFPGVLILRVDASLYFANLKFFEDRLEKALAARTDARWVIVDLSGVNDVDAVAVHTLGELVERYRVGGIRFAFASMKGPVRDVFARARWAEAHPEALGHLSLEHALRSVPGEPEPLRLDSA
jgi:SulP family sulfate permease